MSEAAVRRTAALRFWAVPGSRHDKVVRFLKVALPSAVGVMIGWLAMAPLENRGDVSFILDKNKVQTAEERMRVDSARYVGQDNKGQPFEIVAQSALQRSSQDPIVDIRGMMARLDLPQGPLMISANQGNYDLDAQKVAINGPVRVAGPNGYRILTRDVTVDLKERHLESSGPVEGEMRLGSFEAGRLSADLDERNVVLDGGARLKIVQGAVR